MKNFKNLEANGRQLVSVVRIRPVFPAKPLDTSDFVSPRIWAIIPGWLDNNGQITSLKTGNRVPVYAGDEVRIETWGTAYDYEGGEKIIYTRRWENGKPIYFFAERTCADNSCCPHKAYGEYLKKAPKIPKWRQ
ncbi:MAG: hypothetical protein J5895_00810 [Alphaproteobacteria bacterium]|nr:hypothetical protein [Alphaproteobacteria bacterium]